ncbi:MAG: hypothetical protein AB1733_20230 [Thermodesulfobacteriota bacterium]
MNTQQMAEWVDARLCNQCRQGYTCDDYDCEQAKKVSEILRKMVPFAGKDRSGNEVSGWLVPE